MLNNEVSIIELREIERRLNNIEEEIKRERWALRSILSKLNKILAILIALGLINFIIFGVLILMPFMASLNHNGANVAQGMMVYHEEKTVNVATTPKVVSR